MGVQCILRRLRTVRSSVELESLAAYDECQAVQIWGGFGTEEMNGVEEDYANRGVWRRSGHGRMPAVMGFAVDREVVERDKGLWSVGECLGRHARGVQDLVNTQVAVC